MCSVVFIGDAVLETQGALKEALGPIIYLEDAPPGARGSDTDCLCWVNIPAMAERNGACIHFDGLHWHIAKDE